MHLTVMQVCGISIMIQETKFWPSKVIIKVMTYVLAVLFQYFDQSYVS